MDSSVPIVDAHQHFWDLDNLKYEWLKGPHQTNAHPAGDLAPIRRNYFLDDFKEDTKNQNVVKSVHVEAACANIVEETKWLQSLADCHGFPHGIVAHADLSSPDLRTLLDEYKKFPNVRGLRQLLNWSEDPAKRATQKDLLKEEAWFKGLQLLEEYGLSYDLQVWQHQLSEAAALLAKVPNIQIILNHTGMPTERTNAVYQEWKEGMKKLAELPNVAVKISGLGMTDHNWTVESVRPYVITTIQVFGVDRCMFGSNFPVDKLLGDYDTLFNAFKEITLEYSANDQQKLFHDNAIRFYRL